MKYEDRVYGEREIGEEVILELIASPAIQRLKRIDQAGYNPFWVNELRAKSLEHSRFYHSVGVCLLLKKYGASIEEQIAGLIHDVSHTAFSHCTEFILNAGSEEKQNHQDNIFKKFVERSEIPGILEKYGFDSEYILDDNNFPLKEKGLPDLCADRIDYILRDAMVYDRLKQEKAQYFLDNLKVENNIWFFEDMESAKNYAQLFLRMNNLYYSGLPAAAMFRAVSEFVKYCLEKEYISESDLHTYDDFVVEKAGKYLDEDGELKLLFKRMNNQIGYKDEKSGNAKEIVCKSRIVNPLFFENGIIKRLSDALPGWEKVIEEEMKPKRYFVKFER